MNHWSSRDAIVVFLMALSSRFISVAITTITSLNTYAQGDANGFAASARSIGATISQGSLPVLDLNSIYDVWGVMLSPFWLLPGPSRVYARFGMAILGALAVYNVYIIVQYYNSKQAGAIAVIPLLVYPSFLFIHATVIREAMVLFGLTTTARLLLVPSLHLRLAVKYAVAATLLGVVVLLREANLPIYVLVLTVAVFLKEKPRRRYKFATKAGVGVGLLITPIAAIPYGQQVLHHLVFLRQARARGRTAYLSSILPDTIPKAIAFSWIGTMYFLFSPFPWMISAVMDFVAMIEGIGNLIYTVASLSGVRFLAKKTLPGTMALVVGILIGSVLYGLGTVNVGTAVRHRQMILWAIFLLGGIGIAQYIRITGADGLS